jgi:hypothetical protein
MNAKQKYLRVGLAVLSVASMGLMVGCMAMPAGLSPSSEPLDPSGYTEIGPASGSFTSIAIMGFPVSEPGSPGLKALARAEKASGGDALVRLSIDTKTYPCGPVTIIQTEVSGTGVRKLKNR